MKEIYMVGEIDCGADYVTDSFADALEWVRKADENDPKDWYIDRCPIRGTPSTVSTLKHHETKKIWPAVIYGRKV